MIERSVRTGNVAHTTMIGAHPIAGLWITQNLYRDHYLIRTADISIGDITANDLREVADDMEASMDIRSQRQHIQALYPGDENREMRHKLYSTPGLLGSDDDKFASMVKEIAEGGDE